MARPNTRQQARMQTLLRNGFHGDAGTPATTLRCHIREAYQLFGATLISENLEIRISIQLDLLDAEGKLIQSVIRDESVFRRLNDVKHKPLEQLYQLTLDAAAFNGLKLLLVQTQPE
ncbi:hypothetical protein FY528_01435 [Hymenobacter lutimineralis]|uniref:Uncharacterized protein n=1 Tax=Hymenobacter lutimineralis TaxID=2606448 RepID=A0A5D6VGB6_9BACT|nr:hypothetical protein [Hymenobacter lutimineralis]TYZ14420.1 hypothetical protein FY528_01435 [Hymenobacter lutimineralis]